MKFYFEIITDSHVVLRSNPERSRVPLTQFSPMATSSKTMGQYHKQDMDIDADKIQDPSCWTFTASFTSLPPTPFSLYLLFLCWDSFCIYFKCVCNYLLKHFMMGALKYLLEFSYLSHFGVDIFWLSFWFSVRLSWFLHAEWFFIKTWTSYLLCYRTLHLI